jgi:prepilin-type N-terminal cleavage/methylation domain-containing protein
MNNQKGMTLIEILAVIAIISIIASLAVLNLSKFRNARTLQNTTEDVVSFLNLARNNTIASLNSSNYGVHFEEDQMFLFEGLSYNSLAENNQRIIFEPSVRIKSGGINLNGGGNDVVFKKISGDTLNYGTIVLELRSDVNQFRTITINKLGIISRNQ